MIRKISFLQAINIINCIKKKKYISISLLHILAVIEYLNIPIWQLDNILIHKVYSCIMPICMDISLLVICGFFMTG